ncbi:MAG: tetratricopeptide repeat protein [Acidobacteria bacterium]|nr:MAG: tetratricopeptide repeat protein [Acidobacteriota bacterium]
MRPAICLNLVLVFACSAGLAQSAEDYLAQANQLIATYQWPDALRLLNQAAAKYPEYAELRLRQAHLAIRLGNAKGAEGVLRWLLLNHPGDPDILRTLGEAALALGNHSEAARHFSEALSRKPDDSTLLHNLSLTLLLQGRKEEALKSAAEAVAKGKPTAESRRLYALLLSLNGRHEESDKQMKAAVRDDPGNARLLFELSEVKRHDKKYGEALEYLDMAVEADPENPLYYSALARLYERFKQAKLAGEYQAKADRLMAAFTSYSGALGASTRGSVSKAVELLEPAVKNNPEFVTGKLLLADLLSRSGRRERALALYEEALRQDPTRLEAREKSAWIKTQQGDPASALELLRGAPHAVQNEILTRAYLYISQARWQEALDLLEQVELSYPLNHQLLKLMSTCLRELGKTDEAIQHLERARAIKRDDPEVEVISREIRLEQATRLMNQGNWAGAIRVFSWLVRSNAAEPRYSLNLAYSRERSGDLSGAVNDYVRGLEKTGSHDPATVFWARKNLGGCLTRLERYREAAVQWEAVIKQERSAENLLQLGICYSNLERNAEAERTLEEALQKGDRTGELLYNAGVTKMRAMKTEEGWNYVREAARKGYQPAKQLLAKAAKR